MRESIDFSGIAAEERESTASAAAAPAAGAVDEAGEGASAEAASEPAGSAPDPGERARSLEEADAEIASSMGLEAGLDAEASVSAAQDHFKDEKQAALARQFLELQQQVQAGGQAGDKPAKKGQARKSTLVLVVAMSVVGIAVFAAFAVDHLSGGSGGDGSESSKTARSKVDTDFEERLKERIASRTSAADLAAGRPAAQPAGGSAAGLLGAGEPDRKPARKSRPRRRGRRGARRASSPSLVEDRNMSALDNALEDRFGGRPTLPGYGEEEPVPVAAPRRPLKDDSPIGVYVLKEDQKGGKDRLGVPSASFLEARLLSKARGSSSRAPVLAALTADFEAGGGVVVPRGTKLIGHASSDEKRLHIRFRKLVFNDGREVNFTGIAMMADGSAGIVGRVKSSRGSSVKGGLASAALDTAAEVIPGGDTVAGRLGNRAGQAGIDHLQDQASTSSSSGAVVTVAAGTLFQVFVEEGF